MQTPQGAEKLHDEMKAHIEKITQLDDDNLKFFEKLKKEAVANKPTKQVAFQQKSARHQNIDHILQSQLQSLDALDADNAQQRKQLLDGINNIVKTNNTKADQIQENIKKSLEKRKSLRDSNHKKFDLVKDQFDSLHKQALSLATIGSPDRWLNMVDTRTRVVKTYGLF